MIRKAFLMEVRPGKEAEYERRHNPIWPELQEIFRTHGVHNYSIFLHEKTAQLFGYVEIESEERWNSIADTAVCRKWWGEMKMFLVSDSEDSPKAREEELREVFHLE
ncbi:L-rhamnose mutarotase [Verrucomicrobiota bacterium]